MFAKIIVVAILLGIISSLAMALFYMVKDKGAGTRSARALTVRIGVSIGLFVLLLILGATGVLTPHGVTP
jgi:hypothetical protein